MMLEYDFFATHGIKYKKKERPRQFHQFVNDWESRLTMILDQLEIDFDLSQATFVSKCGSYLEVPVGENGGYKIHVNNGIPSEYGKLLDKETLELVSSSPSKALIKRLKPVVDYYIKKQEKTKSLNPKPSIVL